MLDDVSVCKQELDTYRTGGGGTVCEMSVIGMRRKNHAPQDLVEISRLTSLNVVSATGFYWAALLPEWVGSLSVREMADMLLGEAVEGVGGVRCGVMYVACSYPLKDVEKKTLQAAVLAHRDTGMRLVYNVFWPIHLCILAIIMKLINDFF